MIATLSISLNIKKMIFFIVVEDGLEQKMATIYYSISYNEFNNIIVFFWIANTFLYIKNKSWFHPYRTKYEMLSYAIF